MDIKVKIVEKYEQIVTLQATGAEDAWFNCN